MVRVKYLGYASTLTIPGVEGTKKPGDEFDIAQNVLDDLLLRGHTFEGVAVPVTRLPAPHEVPDEEPDPNDEFSRAGALRRVQTERGAVLALVDADPPPIAALGQGTNVLPPMTLAPPAETGETPKSETPEETEVRTRGKAKDKP